MKVTSLLLLVLIAFVCVHDVGYAVIALIGDGYIAELAALNDCSGSACNEAEACQCPVHLLEKFDDPTPPATLTRLVSAYHFPIAHGIPVSRSLSPADRPPKA
jgi:hypothetical protein